MKERENLKNEWIILFYAKKWGEERDELMFEDCEEEKNPRKELRFFLFFLTTYLYSSQC